MSPKPTTFLPSREFYQRPLILPLRFNRSARTNHQVSPTSPSSVVSSLPSFFTIGFLFFYGLYTGCLNFGSCSPQLRIFLPVESSFSYNSFWRGFFSPRRESPCFCCLGQFHGVKQRFLILFFSVSELNNVLSSPIATFHHESQLFPPFCLTLQRTSLFFSLGFSSSCHSRHSLLPKPGFFHRAY